MTTTKTILGTLGMKYTYTRKVKNQQKGAHRTQQVNHKNRPSKNYYKSNVKTTTFTHVKLAKPEHGKTRTWQNQNMANKNTNKNIAFTRVKYRYQKSFKNTKSHTKLIATLIH